MRQVEPYTVLASIYDRVMDHVDYEEWAGYVDALLALHAPGAQRIMELGAGTGRFAEELAALRHAELTLTDRSAEMLERAGARLRRTGIEADYVVVDFTVVPAAPLALFDAVLLLYDGFNYALTEQVALRILEHAAQLLRPGGVFIFDHVTPANSTNADNLFEDDGSDGSVSYVRRSEYDAESGIHRTIFEILTPAGDFLEEHRQRIWTTAEVERIAARGMLRTVAAYDGYSLRPAREDSERIHRVMRKPV